MNLTRPFRYRVLSFVPNLLAPSVYPGPIQNHQTIKSQRHNHQHDSDNRRAKTRMVHRARFLFSAIREEYTSRPTVAATTNTTTTTSSACVIRPPSWPRPFTSVPVQMRLMFRFGSRRNSFLGPEVLPCAGLKLLCLVLDPQVVPHHIADHRNETDDQKDVNHPS